MNLLGITLFAMLCALCLLCSILYSGYQTRKAIRHIQDLTDKTITEIRQECEGLLNDIAEKYLKEN